MVPCRQSLTALLVPCAALAPLRSMKQHFSIMGQFSAQHTTDGTLCDTCSR